ncbi:MAG: PrsW family glutamic-type intramembrane protease [Candidatus Aminicenantes bacterium]|nr:PrsW family glutamic-type intramembrane protease [Candidatus Aminicenantes bacterium]
MTSENDAMANTLPILALKTLVGLLPVLVFLLALVFLDSYKLVRLNALLLAVLGGGLAAAIGYFANTNLMPLFQRDFALYSRYIAPLIEEGLKACVVLAFFRARRIGFLVDAAIFGFAAGAGFSLAENIYYLNASPEAGLAVWIIRGFGTAMMHGGTTAIFAAVAKSVSDRRDMSAGLAGLPGFAIAFLVHSAFNHFLLPPLLATAAILVFLPLVAVNVFLVSERGTRKWLDVGFDSDVELLGLITAGRASTTKVGQYLLALKGKFPGEVVADMLCLIRLHLELSISAKGLLLLREAGFPAPADPAVSEKFAELKYLEKSVGKTGMLAVGPLLHRSRRDLWELHMLGMK